MLETTHTTHSEPECSEGGASALLGQRQGSADPAPAAALAAPLSLAAAALLAACGGGGGGTSTGSAVSAGSAGTVGDAGGASGGVITEIAAAPGFNNFPNALTDEDAARFLLQSQLDASDTNISAVRSVTFAAYLQQEFAKPVGQTGWDWLEARGYGVSDTNRYFFSTYPAEFMLWQQLFTANDGMRKRVALALSEFFVASMQSAEFTWRGHGYAQYWDVLGKNAFGNYRQLLEDVTLNPAMGYFLNTKGNQKEDTKTGRSPDENYGREVMQLFSIGLYQLNLDGTEKTSGGKKIETYTQDDVSNIARAFTGYDFDNSDGIKVAVQKSDGSGPDSYTIDSRDTARKPMALNATRHSTLAATFLGTTVAAGATGAVALKAALDALFNHPNVGPFFGRQMIQRLVTSNPSPAYVARVAGAFNNNGAGVRGDLKAVWMAILLDDEARSAQTLASADFGKLREPMLRFIQWGRSFGLNSAAGSWKLFATTRSDNSLGQSPLFSPSVFNFFRPGFVPPSTALAVTKSPAPEFQLVNETTVGGYLNYMQDVIRNGIYTYDPAVPQNTYVARVQDMTTPYTAELALVNDPAALVRRLSLILCAGQMSAGNQKLIADALAVTPITATSTAAKKLDRVAAAVLLVMASPEYLVQK